VSGGRAAGSELRFANGQQRVSADARPQHLSEVEAVADSLLARLDELTATLGAVTSEAAAQGAALEPAFRQATVGLARDFAYVDGVGVRRTSQERYAR
jgi:hypothetical protein